MSCEGGPMSSNPEQTPLDQPFSGAESILKRELREVVGNFFYRFDHEKCSKTTMSHLLRLYQTMILSRAQEIGTKVYHHAQKLMQSCTDYANGHGKIETVYKSLDLFNEDLRS